MNNIQSNVSSRQRPDASATFESLNDDTLTTTLQFVGDKSYKSFGVINKHCTNVYLNTEGMTKRTFLYGYAPLSVIKVRIERAIQIKLYNWELFERVGKGVVLYNRLDVLEWALEERKKSVLNKICVVAAGEERFDILDEVWNNVNEEEDKKYIFEGVLSCAARGGKLEVLKWVENKENDIRKEWCAGRAAEYGHLHILQWLKEERGLQLDGGLYDCAISTGLLHVMKWLREQEVDWDEDTFRRAVWNGNLNILQWLHNEGCPWPEYLGVDERELTPELIDWLRVNGYGNRLY